MNRRKRILVTMLIAAAFCGLAAYGRTVKKSFVDNSDFDSIPDTALVYCTGYNYNSYSDDLLDDEKINSAADLEEQSDLVVKCRVVPNEKRQIYTEAVLTAVEVLDTYKGAEDEKIIYVFEPFSVVSDEIVDANAGYCCMHEDREYILYLTALSQRTIGKEKRLYVTASPAFGKFPTDSRGVGELDYKRLRGSSADGMYRYKDLRDMEFIPPSHKSYEKYSRLLDEVLSRTESSEAHE